MRKVKTNVKVALVLIASVLAFTMVSCQNPSKGSKEKKDSYKAMTSEFQTYYLSVADADLAGLEGFHLKNLNTDKAVGIVIDKIFASDTQSEDDAVAVFNFDDPETGSKYWGFDAGTKADGVWSSGEVAAAPEGTGETYITGFATPEFSTHAYVGIVAKNVSDTLTGDDISLIPIIGDPITDKAVTFRTSFVTK